MLIKNLEYCRGFQSSGCSSNTSAASSIDGSKAVYEYVRQNGGGTCVNYACLTYELCEDNGLECLIVWTGAGLFGHVARPSIYAWLLASVDNKNRRKSRVALLEWAKMCPEEFFKLFIKFDGVNDPQIRSDKDGKDEEINEICEEMVYKIQELAWEFI